MPRVKRRRAKRNFYTDHERRVLLTGVPISHVSTRFGHIKSGWNVPEIAAAWCALRNELLVEWQRPEFDYFRERYSEPFAERLLSKPEGDH